MSEPPCSEVAVVAFARWGCVGSGYELVTIPEPRCLDVAMTAQRPPSLLQGSAWPSLPPQSLAGHFRPLDLLPPHASLGVVSPHLGSTFGAHLGVLPSPGKRPGLGGWCLSTLDPAGRAAHVLFSALNPSMSSGRGEHVSPRGARHEASGAGWPAGSSGTARNNAGCIPSPWPVVEE